MIIAVQYSYATDVPLAEIRPAHREYLGGLADDGVIVASGPLTTANGALLIVSADSPEDALRILEADPFYIENCIAERTATEWLPVIGVLKQYAQ